MKSATGDINDFRNLPCYVHLSFKAYIYQTISEEKGCINDVQGVSSVPRSIKTRLPKTEGKIGGPGFW